MTLLMKSIKSGKAILIILWMEFWAGHDIVNSPVPSLRCYSPDHQSLHGHLHTIVRVLFYPRLVSSVIRSHRRSRFRKTNWQKWQTIIVPSAEDKGDILWSVLFLRGKSEQQSSIADSSDTDSHKHYNTPVGGHNLYQIRRGIVLLNHLYGLNNMTRTAWRGIYWIATIFNIAHNQF